MASFKQKMSIAWKIFKISDEDQTKAKCQLCHILIARGHKVGYFTTTNMLKHLSTKHSKELQEEKKKQLKEQEQKLSKNTLSVASTSKLNVTKQLTLTETLNRNKIWDINNNKAQKIHKYTAEMIAIDLQPFSVIEDTGFIRLINHLCPNYKLSSRKYIKEKIIQDIYVKVRSKIQAEINIATHLSFTSDGWTASTANI